MLHHPQSVYNYVKQEYTTVYILLSSEIYISVILCRAVYPLFIQLYTDILQGKSNLKPGHYSIL